jgi:hypothetical protein
MAKVVFTPNVQRHVACPEAEAPGCTVREVLDIFAANPQARGYVLDDQSALRRHMTIFVAGLWGAVRVTRRTKHPRMTGRCLGCGHRAAYVRAPVSEAPFCVSFLMERACRSTAKSS